MFAKFFIDRPVFAMVISLLILLGGAVSIFNLPISQYPEITPPTVVVSATYPGADAETVEEAIALPLEEQINGAQGQETLTSTCSDSTVSLTVTFSQDRSQDLAAVDVQNRVAAALPKLPQVTVNQGVTTSKQSTNALVYMSIFSPKGTNDEKFLVNYTNNQIMEKLARIPGVGKVNLYASTFAMRLWLKPDRMAAMGLTVADVAKAVQDQNQLAPAGGLGKAPGAEGTPFQLSVRVKGRLSLEEDFENIVLRANPDGSALRLKDVARAELGSERYEVSGSLNGKPAATLGIFQTPGTNALQTTEAIKAVMVKAKADFPQDMDYALIVDSSKFLNASIHETLETFFEALILVLLVVGLFLQSWRATLVPMLAVPVSLVGTFTAFVLLGFSINTLTLFAMVLAIGIVVDDAIVVVEAVQHHLDHGLSDPKAATRKAMDEVGSAVIAIALVLACVFVPVAFMGGIVGTLYKQFALSVAVSVILSALVALTLTPALCALLQKPRTGETKGLLGRFFAGFERLFTQLTERYGRGVSLAVRRSGLVALSLGALYLGTLGLFKMVPTGFVPEEDQGYCFVAIQLPEAASKLRTHQVAEDVARLAKGNASVQDVMVVEGFNILTSASGPNSAFALISLKPWDERKSKSEQVKALMGALQAQFMSLKDASVMAFNPPALPGLGTAGGFSMQVQDRSGLSPMELFITTQKLVQEANKQPEISHAFSFFRADTPNLDLAIDRDKALRMGVALGDIYGALQAYLGGYPINDFSRFGRNYKVYMQADTPYRMNERDLVNIKIRNNRSEMVPLTALVSGKPSVGPTYLNRFGLFRSATITGSAKAGYSSGQALTAMERVAKQVLPKGFGYEWDGVSRQEMASSGKATPLLVLAFLVVFLLLAAQYESWSIPFAVLLTVPIALGGALLGQWIGGQQNNVYAQIGMVTLIGLAAKNAILIVEFAKENHDKGMNVAEAAIQAAKLRLRPILMTSSAFILGVVPLVIASGAGAGSRKALGVAVFSGLFIATALGIFTIPALYHLIQSWLDRRKERSAQG